MKLRKQFNKIEFTKPFASIFFLSISLLRLLVLLPLAFFLILLLILMPILVLIFDLMKFCQSIYGNPTTQPACNQSYSRQPVIPQATNPTGNLR